MQRLMLQRLMLLFCKLLLLSGLHHLHLENLLLHVKVRVVLSLLRVWNWRIRRPCLRVVRTGAVRR